MLRNYLYIIWVFIHVCFPPLYARLQLTRSLWSHEQFWCWRRSSGCRCKCLWQTDKFRGSVSQPVWSHTSFLSNNLLMPAFLLGQSRQRRPVRWLCLGLRLKTDSTEEGKATCCNHRDGRMMSINGVCWPGKGRRDEHSRNWRIFSVRAGATPFLLSVLEESISPCYKCTHSSHVIHHLTLSSYPSSLTSSHLNHCQKLDYKVADFVCVCVCSVSQCFRFSAWYSQTLLHLGEVLTYALYFNKLPQ